MDMSICCLEKRDQDRTRSILISDSILEQNLSSALCFDVDKWLFFESINKSVDVGATLTNVTRPVKDIIINCQSKVTKYKPEFPFAEFKKPITDLAFVINESDIYDEVDIAGKVYNFTEAKSSIAGKR